MEWKITMGYQPTVHHHHYQRLKTGPAEMRMTANIRNTSGDISCINVTAQTQAIPSELDV